MIVTSKNQRIDVTWNELHRDALLLAWRLHEVRHFKGIIAVSRGGLFTAQAVAYELDIHYVDTYCIKSYNHQEQTVCEDLKVPQLPAGTRTDDFIVIDDLADTGQTFKHIKTRYPTAHYAAIYAKPQGESQCDSFITEVSQNTWIYFPWD
jgi:xanthine phosphoribosyltransferase